jgi:3-hydroxybutyryl-CoA dehydrogenase
MKTIAVIRQEQWVMELLIPLQSGFTVKLIDVSEQSLDKGMATIANLDRMIAKITEEDKAKTITNIITYRYKRWL